MADITVVSNTSTQLKVRYEQKNFELGANRHDYRTTIAATANDTVYAVGEMLAMNPADGKVAKFDNTATSTNLWKATFFGFNTIAVTLANTETAELRIVIAGDVAKEMIEPQAKLNYCTGGHFNVIQTAAPISGSTF